MRELAEVLKLAHLTILNRLSAGILPLKTYNDGVRFYKTSDVAEYLDSFK